MIKELQYKGYATEPSDYECPDGQLATSLNLINEDNQLKPVFQPRQLAQIPDGYNVICIHNVTTTKHYILTSQDKHTLAYVNHAQTDTPVVIQTFNGIITSATPHGNVIITTIANENGADNNYIHYTIWRDGSYNVIGSDFPKLEMQFRLDCRYIQQQNTAKETGIKIVKTDQVETIEYANLIKTTDTGELTPGESIITITPDQPLQQGTSYKINVTRTQGNVSFQIAAVINYNDGTYEYAGYCSFLTSYPYHIIFVTQSGRTVQDIELHILTKNTSRFTFNLLEGTQTESTYAIEDTEENYNAVMARANAFVAKYATNENKFIHPFFVRYALRMYDGTYVCPSPPCLMIPNKGQAPIIWATGDRADKPDMFFTTAAVATLKGRILQNTGMQNWKEIITGVAIAVSPPIYSYDQGHEWKKGEIAVKIKGVDLTVEDRSDDTWSYGTFDGGDGTSSATYLFNKYNYYQGSLQRLIQITPPQFSQRQNADNITKAATFHVIREYDITEIEQLAAEWNDIDIEAGALSTLQTRQTINDDNTSLSQRAGNAVTTYNARLVIADITVNQFKGHKPVLMQGLAGAYVNTTQDRTTLKKTMAIVTVAKQGDVHLVCAADNNRQTNNSPLFWFYYPDNNATKAVIWQNDLTGRWRRAEISLKQHGLLNAAVWFDNFNEPEWSEWIPYLQLSSEQKAETDMQETTAIIRAQNKIQQSQPENPFAFSDSLTTTVGQGTVVGIRSAAKALSQGQFGAYPLYAFTTDGVWALEVAADGAFSARQPITRDVCVNPDSITQIDTSVLFATDRGIMLISGSQTQCITDSIFSEAPFNVLNMPGIDQLHTKLGHNADACLPVKPFLAFLEGCQMVYDYVHQRIFVYNPTMEDNSPKYTYAYVFSLKSKMWGMVYSTLASSVNAYPDALAMTQDNKLVSFSDTDEQVCKGLYITRPLKLEAADVHKTVSALIQRGHFQRGDVGTVLYGSRDLYTWHLIWSSKDHYLRGFRGTPYKYFRIAGLASLTDGKSIFGASVNFDPRHTNQLR